jgi:hypothetical protein
VRAKNPAFEIAQYCGTRTASAFAAAAGKEAAIGEPLSSQSGDGRPADET